MDKVKIIVKVFYGPPLRKEKEKNKLLTPKNIFYVTRTSNKNVYSNENE
jgi:hypothetical protein